MLQITATTYAETIEALNKIVQSCTQDRSSDIAIGLNGEHSTMVCIDEYNNRHSVPVAAHWWSKCQEGYITLSGRVVEKLKSGEQKVLPFGGHFNSASENAFQIMQGWRA